MSKWKIAAPALLLLLLLFSPPAAPVFAPRGSEQSLPVLMYHSLVTDDRAADAYVCPISRVESDFAWLRNNGYTAVTPAQLAAYAAGTGTLPPKPVLITLDDGYRNNLTLLPPLLERYDLYAVIAVVGEYADIYTASGEDNSPHSCMGWSDLARAAEEPRLFLAAHSYYFHHLSGRKGAGRAPGESRESWQAAFCSDTRRLLDVMAEQGLPAPTVYAYPYGAIEPEADALLAQMGFSITLSCSEKSSVLRSGDPASLFSLGRFNRDGRLSTEAFMKKIAN